MNITPCPACQGPLSSKASSCPRCGHSVKKTGCFAILGWILGGATICIMGLFALVFVIGYCTYSPPPRAKGSPQNSNAPTPVVSTKSSDASKVQNKQSSSPPKPESTTKTKAPSEKAAELKSQKETEKQRGELIAEVTKAVKLAIKGGYIDKVDKVDTIAPVLFTGILWDSTPIDFKNNVLKSIGMLSMANRKSDNADFLSVIVKDGRSGKTIGAWRAYSGYVSE